MPVPDHKSEREQDERPLGEDPPSSVRAVDAALELAGARDNEHELAADAEAEQGLPRPAQGLMESAAEAQVMAPPSLMPQGPDALAIAVAVDGAGPSVVRTASPVPSPVPSADDDTEVCEPAKCFGVLLVGFDHALGPTVEFSHPPDLNHNEQLLAEHLPFFALPDGAHAVRPRPESRYRERGARTRLHCSL